MSNFGVQRFQPDLSIHRMPEPTLLYLLLGSNLGDRHHALSQAQGQLEQALGPATAVSSVYETAPWGLIHQPAFLNQVLGLYTLQLPGELLKITQGIEKKMGREKKEKWGARSIDIDILYYGDQRIQTDGLTIPHPLLHERRFTLVPLAEIAPRFIHPVLRLSQRALLEQCTDPGEVIKVAG
jgi:2-amino-4-hydroxy-6-hydroxymethyldihydropteridine diphosphokinase